MKKAFLLLLGIGLFSATVLAQRANNQFSIGADAAVPTGDFDRFSKAGFGTTIKMLYGIGRSGQLTLTSGYVSFRAKEMFKELLGVEKMTQTIVPVFGGYRHHFDGFYVEPQLGYGIYTSKMRGGSLQGRDSEGAFSWAAGFGFLFGTMEVGMRYQNANKGEEGFGLIGFRAAYNFSL